MAVSVGMREEQRLPDLARESAPGGHGPSARAHSTTTFVPVAGGCDRSTLSTKPVSGAGHMTGSLSTHQHGREPAATGVLASVISQGTMSALSSPDSSSTWTSEAVH